MASFAQRILSTRMLSTRILSTRMLGGNSIARRVLRTSTRNDAYYRSGTDLKKMDTGQKLYDYFRHSFTDYKELRKYGMKFLREKAKNKRNTYGFQPSDLENKKLVDHIYKLAMNDMFYAEN